MTITCEQLVKNVQELISFPEAAGEFLHLINDEESSTGEIAETIERDPGLATRVLRIANSPYYGFSHTISNIRQAVTAIGRRHLRNLVISECTVGGFNKLPNGLLNLRAFWRHSLYCAVSAKLIAQNKSLPNADDIFTAGLLHDIGILVIFQQLPIQTRQILSVQRKKSGPMKLYEAEVEVLGFDHADVGGTLAKAWNFPDLLIEVIANQHCPSRATTYRQETEIVYLSNAIAVMMDMDAEQAHREQRASAEQFQQIGFGVKEIESITQSTRESYRDALAIISAA